MKRRHLLAASLVLVAIGLAVPAAPALADVPDARLVVSDVTVTPEAPEPGNTTTVEFTVENSGGSATAVAVERVALQNRDRYGAVHAEADDIGSLSVGDGVTLELATAFSEPGVKELELVVETETEADEDVTVTRPVTVVVGGVDAAGVEDDVQVDARTVLPSELEEDEQVDVGLGADAGGLLGDGGDDEDDPELRTPLVRVEVTNFGEGTARRVAVRPSTEERALARMAVPDVEPGESEAVIFDAGDLAEPTVIEFEAAYEIGSRQNTSTTTLEYRPNRGDITVTDVDMTLDNGTVTVTGHAANVGLGEVNSAVVSLGETDHVEPTYPAREYFVGTVPESQFVRFDVTADVDHQNATTIPVTVSYLADGDPYERTVELEYDARNESDGDDGSGVPLSLVGALVGSATLGFGAALGWRRLRARD